MKKITFILTCLLIFTCNIKANAELSPELQKLRTEIKDFISAEGYVPSIDADGDIMFKSEGITYYISVSNTDTNPYYIVLFREHPYSDSITREKILRVIDACNLKKGIKVLCKTKSYSYRAEIYLTSANTFKESFAELMSQIKNASDNLIELLSE